MMRDGSRLKYPISFCMFWMTTFTFDPLMFSWLTSTMSFEKPSFSSLSKLNFTCVKYFWVLTCEIIFPKPSPGIRVKLQRVIKSDSRSKWQSSLKMIFFSIRWPRIGFIVVKNASKDPLSSVECNSNCFIHTQSISDWLNSSLSVLG